MKKVSLVVLAAGMGSRYGGLKQLDGVGPNGQTIMDYSVFDAIEAGFDQIVFVIRKDFEEEFRTKVLSKYVNKIDCEVAFQGTESCTEGIPSEIIEAREKPWGTAHATLVVKGIVNGPFAVINADDFYGKDAFEKMAEFLRSGLSEEVYAMIGYQLDKTLSENGTVNRGVCQVKDGFMTKIVEGLKIQKTSNGYIHETPNEVLDLHDKTRVSMNFFGFHPSILDYMEKEFLEFGKNSAADPKSEYFIPMVIDNMMNKGLIKVRAIPTDSDWIGVTYQEDKPEVMAKLAKYTEEGIYAGQF